MPSNRRRKPWSQKKLNYPEGSKAALEKATQPRLDPANMLRYQMVGTVRDLRIF